MKGNGRVFQRNRIWWVAYYDNGREFRESSKSRDRKEAVTLLRRRLGEVAAGTRRSPVPRLTWPRVFGMQDLFDLVEQHYHLNDCKSTANWSYLNRLRRRFGTYTVQACTGLAISHYMTNMQRQGRKPETINREMDVLRSAFRQGYRHDLVQRMPYIKRLPQLAVRNEYFSREEIDALLPCLPENLRDVVLFGFLTGWRKGEIVGLQWSNVNRAGEVIRLDPIQNKGRVVRILALQGELTALFERRWRARMVGSTLVEHVFHRGGRRLGDLRPAWPDACRRAGLGHRLFHSLRRSAARNMSLQGVPEKVIMSIMGHKTRVMFDRYNIVTEADQRTYAKRLFGP